MGDLVRPISDFAFLRLCTVLLMGFHSARPLKRLTSSVGAPKKHVSFLPQKPHTSSLICMTGVWIRSGISFSTIDIGEALRLWDGHGIYA